MNKMHKIINITAIFMIIGVFLCSKTAYPLPENSLTKLRVPLDDHRRIKEYLEKTLLDKVMRHSPIRASAVGNQLIFDIAGNNVRMPEIANDKDLINMRVVAVRSILDEKLFPGRGAVDTLFFIDTGKDKVVGYAVVTIKEDRIVSGSNRVFDEFRGHGYMERSIKLLLLSRQIEEWQSSLSLEPPARRMYQRMQENMKRDSRFSVQSDRDFGYTIKLTLGQEAAGQTASADLTRSMLESLIREGKVISQEQAVKFLEEQFKQGAIDLPGCHELSVWFNKLDKRDLIIPEKVQYIEVGKDLQRIEIAQNERKFTADDLLEFINVLNGIPPFIRQDIKKIERVKDPPPDTLTATAFTGLGTQTIFIPDTFHSLRQNGNGVDLTHIHDTHTKKGFLVHEVFEVYITSNNYMYVNERIGSLDKFLDLPLYELIPMIRKVKKDLESTLLIRWIRAKGYRLKEDVFADYMGKDRYFSYWLDIINKSDRIPESEKQELIEMYKLVAMITSCWDGKEVWEHNGYETSLASHNPSEDLIEACRMYILDGGLYRQRMAADLKDNKDTTYFISYLMLRNGPFMGMEYGFTKDFAGVVVLFLGNSVKGERHYNVKGNLWYGTRKFGEIDHRIFLSGKILSLIGDERNIALPETVELGEKLLTAELRKML